MFSYYLFLIIRNKLKNLKEKKRKNIYVFRKEKITKT